jgi:hypothetical protein
MKFFKIPTHFGRVVYARFGGYTTEVKDLELDPVDGSRKKTLRKIRRKFGSWDRPPIKGGFYHYTWPFIDMDLATHKVRSDTSVLEQEGKIKLLFEDPKLKNANWVKTIELEENRLDQIRKRVLQKKHPYTRIIVREGLIWTKLKKEAEILDMVIDTRNQWVLIDSNNHLILLELWFKRMMKTLVNSFSKQPDYLKKEILFGKPYSLFRVDKRMADPFCLEVVFDPDKVCLDILSRPPTNSHTRERQRVKNWLKSFEG